MSERRPTIDVAVIIEGQRLTPFLIRLVVLSWTVTFLDGFDMNAISFAAPVIRSALDLSPAMMGKVFSFGLIGTMIGGLLLGWLGDRIGRRPTIILATASFGVLTLALAFARSYAALLTLRLLDGIAIGGMLPVCWALNIEYVGKRYRATIVTLIMVGYSVGLSAGGPVANWLMPRYGWGALFVFGGGLSLAATLALLFALPESIRFLVSQGRRSEVVARLLQRLAPDRALARDASFTLGDEEASALAGLFADGPRWQTPLLRLKHVVSVLFAGSLRWITPMLWLAYIFSSMAVFFFATWSPLVFEALGYSRAEAAWAASVNALAGALGGLLLMRFTDARGAIAVAFMPLVAAPLLLAAGFVDLGYWGFLAAAALISLFLIGGHFGLHSIAGIFYPSAYRGNGAGWAISVAKIGAIAGPWIAGDLLSAGLPLRNIYAVVAVCPMVFVAAIAIVGVVHTRLLRRERRDAPAETRPRLARAAPG